MKKRRSGGSGTISSVARVMIPSVPSLPTNSCVSSGPTAWRGTETVSISSPPASRHPQREHEVLDLAVARGEHAGAARGDVAADGRPLRRGRVVRQHQAALVERALELAAVDARLGGDRQRALVDLDDLVERAQVDHQAAVHGHRAALRAGPAAPGDDRHVVGGRDPQRGGDVVLGARDARRRRDGRAASRWPRPRSPANTCRRCRRQAVRPRCGPSQRRGLRPAQVQAPPVA